MVGCMLGFNQEGILHDVKNGCDHQLLLGFNENTQPGFLVTHCAGCSIGNNPASADNQSTSHTEQYRGWYDQNKIFSDQSGKQGITSPSSTLDDVLTRRASALTLDDISNSYHK